MVVVVVVLLLLLLLLVVSPARSCTVTQPFALRVHAPRTPACLPPTEPVQHREGQIGVSPHHPSQLGDPHEVLPASAIVPLHAQPAAVGSTRLYAHNRRTETSGRCVLAAF